MSIDGKQEMPLVLILKVKVRKWNVPSECCTIIIISWTLMWKHDFTFVFACCGTTNSTEFN